MDIKIAVAMMALAPGLALADTWSRQGTIMNNLDRSRSDAPVVVKIADLKCPFVPKSAIVKVDGKEIPSQLDDLNADKRPDELAFVVDMPASASQNVEIVLSDAERANAYPPRTFAQMLVRGYKNAIVPIGDISVDGNVDSYTLLYGHGVMFESELNGYRIYFDPKQTLDPYGKKQKRLELEATQFYPTKEHQHAGYGDDVLMVGSSCGVGAFKGWSGAEATHIAPVSRRSQRVIASGPVRAIAEVKAEDWEYNGKKLGLNQRFTQYAGHRDVIIKVMFDQPLGEESFAIGVQNIMGNETQHLYGPRGTVASWGRYWPVGDTINYPMERLAMATAIPSRFAKLRIEDANGYYYSVSSPGHKELEYATMFTCGKEGEWGFATPQQWWDMLEPWQQELDSPVIFSLND